MISIVDLKVGFKAYRFGIPTGRRKAMVAGR
jgi:hypothetical protein